MGNRIAETNKGTIKFELLEQDAPIYDKGTVAMSNSGANTNGSQFFIMHIDYPLPPDYTKFGKVIEGQDVVNSIAMVDRNHNDKPHDPVVMNKVYIEDAAA